LLTEKKIILIVLDGVGAGELPDASDYGDAGANTLGHIAEAVGSLKIPNLLRLGLGNIMNCAGLAADPEAEGCFGRMKEASKGKDSTTGHWEIAGLLTDKQFPLYPDGFPEELLKTFLRTTGCKGYLGNIPASGTEIIKTLGDEHVRTGFPIVYTSGDSVFQIAAHKDVIPLERLYEICRITRKQVVVGEHRVGRVIARPFIGTSGAYVRTPERRDFAVEPAGPTVLDVLTAIGVPTIGIGKIDDLFTGRGLKEKIHTKSNTQGIEEIVQRGGALRSGFLWANLVDFDMLYGHRQDVRGFAAALEEFDAALPRIRACLRSGDLLMITADHGNDPADRSTDHTREYVPILCWSVSGQHNIDLGTRTTFADAGKTAADFFGTADRGPLAGKSFLPSLF
jgi:phosphopentomutase